VPEAITTTDDRDTDKGSASPAPTGTMSPNAKCSGLGTVPGG